MARRTDHEAAITTARTLHPEDWISHYRIVGPLGAGGMGEVYLAQDSTLERSVALTAPRSPACGFARIVNSTSCARGLIEA